MTLPSPLSERDVCTKRITPALVAAGWDIQTQIREEVGFTKGRIIVRGRLVTRGKAKRADYVLFYRQMRCRDCGDLCWTWRFEKSCPFSAQKMVPQRTFSRRSRREGRNSSRKESFERRARWETPVM